MTIGQQVYSAEYGQEVSIFANTFRLTQVGGYNDSGSDAYLLLINSVTPLAGGENAVQSFKVPAGASFSWEPADGGLTSNFFNLACTWAVSSTPNTYTAAALDFWVYAQGFDESP